MDATKTSRSSWKDPLRRILRRSRRVAFVGLGQELRGDDAAGVLAVRRLAGSERCRRAGEARGTAPFFFEAGPLPEAAAGALRRYAPEWVVFLDAASFEAAPGTIGWIEPGDAAGTAPGTHAWPLSAFAAYLRSELGCRVAILGIQPECMDFDTPATVAVERAVGEIVDEIESTFDSAKVREEDPPSAKKE
jgi:hydrogenase 3 maturation protease